MPLTLSRQRQYHYCAVISAQALPFTLLIVLVEFTVGGLWVLWAAHIRGESAASFVKFGAGMVAVMAALTFWLAAKLTVGDKVDGYPLDPSYMPEARVALALVALLSLPYAVLTIRESRIPSLLAGGSASLVGLVAVALLAQVFALPTAAYGPCSRRRGCSTSRWRWCCRARCWRRVSCSSRPSRTDGMMASRISGSLAC